MSVASTGMHTPPSDQRGKVSVPSVLPVDRDSGVQCVSSEVVVKASGEDDLIIVWIRDGAGEGCIISESKTLLNRIIRQNLL